MNLKDSFFASDAIAKAQGLKDFERNALMFAMMDSESTKKAPTRRPASTLTKKQKLFWGIYFGIVAVILIIVDLL